MSEYSKRILPLPVAQCTFTNIVAIQQALAAGVARVSEVLCGKSSHMDNIKAMNATKTLKIVEKRKNTEKTLKKTDTSRASCSPEFGCVFFVDIVIYYNRVSKEIPC